MKDIYVLVGCEESQAVTIAFRKLGVKAYSCDLLPCSGKHPEWHLQMDVFKAIKLRKWNLIILHPPCTHTATSGNRWYHNSPLRRKAALFTKRLYTEAKKRCDKVLLEQPHSIMQRYIGRKSQSIQPYQFGHSEQKNTWLWIKGLPLLKPTRLMKTRKQKIWLMPPAKDRQQQRSKTYKGIAAAIAKQYTPLL